jgi:hypothetical protein
MFIFSGTKVTFSLKRASDNFVLMKDKLDTENYKTIVSNCVLYVKVAKMSDIIYKQIEQKFETKPITYQFRKFVVKPHTVPYHNAVFTSGNLFPDSEAPDKVLFALVYTKSMTGDMTTNPYQFTRKFEITKDGERGSIEGVIESAYYKKKIAQLEKEQKARDVQFFKLMNLFKDEFKNLRDKGSSTEPSCSPVASGSKTAPKGTRVSKRNQKKKKQKVSKKAKSKNPTFKKPGRVSRGGSEDSELYKECNPNDDDDLIDDEEEEDESDDSEEGDDDEEEEPTVEKEKDLFASVNDLGATLTIFVKSFNLEVNSAAIDQVNIITFI